MKFLCDFLHMKLYFFEEKKTIGCYVIYKESYRKWLAPDFYERGIIFKQFRLFILKNSTANLEIESLLAKKISLAPVDLHPKKVV